MSLDHVQPLRLVKCYFFEGISHEWKIRCRRYYGWMKGDMPGNQMVNIILSSYGTLDDGSVAVTAQLVSDQEVDYAVDKLIKDLEGARKKAKEKIKKMNEKIRSSLNEK